MKVNEKIEDFLLDFPYKILHEKSKLNKGIEHFFIAVDKTDVKNHVIKQYLEAHEKHYPLNDISDISINFMKKTNHYYIFLDSLDKSEAFYKQKFKFVQNNAANILSIKWTGKPVDMSTHLVYSADKYKEGFTEFAVFFASYTKDRLVSKGKAIFEENKPMVEQKINKIKRFLKK